MSKHLKLTLSKRPKDDGLVSMKESTIKGSIFRRLFGRKNKVAIIIPGDDIGTIEIVDDEVKACRGGMRAGNGR